MAFSDLTDFMQNIYLTEYDYQVKVLLLFGWFLLSIFYVFYWHKRQAPTKLFFLGTTRAIVYGVCYLWLYGFWLTTPLMINPNVPLDNLLLFLAYSYTGIFSVAIVILLFNATVWIPKFLANYGKMDLDNYETSAFKAYFGRNIKR